MRARPVRLVRPIRLVRLAPVAALLLALAATVAHAPASGAGAGGGARTRLDRALRQVRDLRARVRQERSSALFGTPQTANAVFEYRKPRWARLEYTGETGVTLYVRADTVWFYQPREKSVLKSLTGAAGAPSLAVFEESVAALERSYRIVEKDGRTLELRPRDPAGVPWRTIEVRLDPGTGLPGRVTIEQGGDERVVLTFSRYERNRGIPAARFVPTFPAGTTVVPL